MDYKEKYEEIIKKLKEAKESMGGYTFSSVVDKIIPELTESEEEKVRKWLIEMVEEVRKANPTNADHNGNCSEAIAWLEKQGERKQHLELKAGHWYFCHQAYCERADILTVKEGERFQCEKDGVVKGLVIKEPAKYFTECDAPAHMEIEQKPAWSEEDENLLKLSLDNLTELMNRFGEKYGKVGDCIDWLKSLRPQHHWKPSEEQMYILEWLTTNVLDDGVVGKKAKAVLSTLIEQLKSL